MAGTSLPLWKRVGRLALWLALPLAIGIMLAWQVPRPSVGLIYLDQEIEPGTGNNLIAQIAYARQQWEIRAVVLIVNSPGGTVVDTEAVYQEIERLRQTKPVVTSIEEMAASGAYYISAGTDYIYAKPSSVVGNIGVIGVLPPSPAVLETVISTGPYKMWGAPADTVLRQMDVAKQGFYEAVRLGRGNALRASREVLLRGEIWPGQEALRLGLIDELGSRSQAIERAADMARIAHYQVVDVRQTAGLPVVTPPAFFFRAPGGQQTHSPGRPGLYLLYVPPQDSGRLP
jgi:protease-4